jgi:hypothetical protein
MKNEQRHELAEPASTLQVVEADPQTDPRWEACISTLPNGSICHHPA